MKWLGTVACAPLGALWVWSAWYWVSVAPSAAFKQEWLRREPIPNNLERLDVKHGTVDAYWVKRSKRRKVGQDWAPALLDLAPELPTFSVGRVQGTPPKFGFRAPSLRDMGALHTLVVVPLWIPFLLAVLPTVFLWYGDRRRITPGHCTACGYDLTGNVSGRCPECGVAIRRESGGT